MQYTLTIRVLFLTLVSLPAGAEKCWTPDDDHTTLSFQVGQPQGPPISGEFPQFHGYLCLDPAHMDDARLRLSVDLDSVDTGLPELDEALRGPMFFDTGRWPEAVFASQSVESMARDNYYRVTGDLTLRNVTRTITVPFEFRPDHENGIARFEGSWRINRLDYGIGQGQWGDTQWADDEVRLKFDVRLHKTDLKPGPD